MPIDEEQEQFVEAAQKRRTPQTEHEKVWFKYVERKRIEAEKGNALYKKPIPMDDTFHSCDMAKNDKNSVFNIRKKNDED